MKKLFLLFACLIAATTFSSAQVLPQEIEVVNSSYSIVVDGNLPIATKFLNSREWIAKTFGDYKSVLQFEDEANGKIIFKGITPLEKEVDLKYATSSVASKTLYPQMSYTVTIDLKDDRFRIKIEDIVFEVKEDFYLLGLITSHRTYSYDEYISAKDYTISNDTKEEFDTLVNDIAELKAKGDSIKKREKRELEEKEEKLAEMEKYINQQEHWQAKRKEEVKFQLAALISSLSASINTSDDF